MINLNLLIQAGIDSALYILFIYSILLVAKIGKNHAGVASPTANITKMKQYGLMATIMGISLISQLLFTSSGADVYTWQRTAEMFLAHGFDYYAYGNNTLTPFYSPLMLAALHELLPTTSWVIIMRIPAFVATLSIAIMLFLVFRGKIGIIATMLFLFNPYYYVYSIVNGQPSAPMLAFLVAAIYILAQNKGVLKSATLLGLALMTSQQATFVIYPVMLLIYAKKGLRVFIAALAVVLAITALFSVPFILGPGFQRFIDGVLFFPLDQAGAREGGSIPSAFAGLWSFTYFLEQTTQFNLSILYRLEVVVTLSLMLLITWRCFRGRMNYYEGALLGATTFLLGTARGNPWHLIIVIPFATIVLLTTQDARIRFASILALLVFQAYRLADNYSYLFNAAPPYYVGDLLTFLTFSALFLLVYNYDRRRLQHVLLRSNPA